MRRVRDGRLPEPFRSWIDRTQPLPPGVVVLPRVLDVSSQVWGAAYTTFLFAVMAGLVGFMMAPLRREPNFGGPMMIFLVLLFAVVLFGVPLLVWRRLWQTYWASRDQKAGALRQGVLIGREGVLVRMSPNAGYPIPMNQFRGAKEWSGGGENSETWVVFETRNGDVNVYADRLDADAAAVNAAVSVARRGR